MAGEEAGIFDEEAAGERGVGVEGDLELAEEREEVGFDVPYHGVVVSLVDRGEWVGVDFAYVVDLLYVGGFEVGEAELGGVVSWRGL